MKLCGNLKPCRRKSLSSPGRRLIKKCEKVWNKIWQNDFWWYIKNHAAKSWKACERRWLKKIKKKFEKRFDKFQNCDILNFMPQFAVKRNGEVEIKKVWKKLKTKFDKSQTCAKLNITPQFGNDNGEVDKRSAMKLKVVWKLNSAM